MSRRLLSYLRQQGLTQSIRVVRAGPHLGVTFQLRNGTEYSGRFHDSPIDQAFAIDWPNKRALLYHNLLEISGRCDGYTREKMDAYVATVFIHELGHLCATIKDPDNCEEYNFLGWEWVLACNLDLEKEWKASLYQYGLGGGAPMREPPSDPRALHNMLIERHAYAMQWGLITRMGRLLTLR